MIQIGTSCIVNGDDLSYLKSTNFDGLFPITCGLSIRSTATASSIAEDGFIYCLQRSIFNVDGEEISPQEFKVSWQQKPDDIYPHLELVTLLLLCNISAEIVSKILF